MRLPPPIRITAPLLALVFGLLATFFDYRLNLNLDLARHLAEVRARAESSGQRLADLSQLLVASGDREALQSVVEATPDIPSEEIVGIIDGDGRLLAASPATLRGKMAAGTALAPAVALIHPASQPGEVHGENGAAAVSAHPFRLPTGATGWVLLVFDRAEAIVEAQDDARTELLWMAAAMALLSFVLWAVLHFGFAQRLARLAQQLEAFGQGNKELPEIIRGGDEVTTLSAKFADMAAHLRARETEQMRLEREVLEISESERRRIGHDMHDSLGQRLTAAALTTNALVTSLETGAPSLVPRGEDIGRQLRDAIAETRAISHGLAPVGLREGGLTSALAALAEETSHRAGVRCVYEGDDLVRVEDPGIAGHLYRIAQEAVNNALKHAAPAEIRLALMRSADAITLEIEDDGVGFEESDLPNEGIGLRVMRYRARLIGGVLEIGSAPAGGTRIICRVGMPA